MADFLRYYGEETMTAELPHRLYARVDHVAQYGSRARSSLAGNEVALLDSVDASWFDETHRERTGPLADGGNVDETAERVSVVALRKRDLDASAGEPGEDEEPGWLELELGP